MKNTLGKKCVFVLRTDPYQPTAPEDSDANEMAGALWERFRNLADNSGPVQSL